MAVCRPMYCVISQLVIYLIARNYFWHLDAWRVTAAYWSTWVCIGDAVCLITVALALHSPGVNPLTNILYPAEGKPQGLLREELSTAISYVPWLSAAYCLGNCFASWIVYGRLIGPLVLVLPRLSDWAALASLAVWPLFWSAGNMVIYVGMLYARAGELFSMNPWAVRHAGAIALLAWCSLNGVVPLWEEDRKFAAFRFLAGAPAAAVCLWLFKIDRKLACLIAADAIVLTGSAVYSIVAGEYDYRVPY